MIRSKLSRKMYKFLDLERHDPTRPADFFVLVTRPDPTGHADGPDPWSTLDPTWH